MEQAKTNLMEQAKNTAREAAKKSSRGHINGHDIQGLSIWTIFAYEVNEGLGNGNVTVTDHGVLEANGYNLAEVMDFIERYGDVNI